MLNLSYYPAKRNNIFHRRWPQLYLISKEFISAKNTISYVVMMGTSLILAFFSEIFPCYFSPVWIGYFGLKP
ncbi:MAG: hypothetical protein CO189_03345 [candidate division Zixibacteria bacterium CG_4_9_14_3_um_filter_46_8]|nr:MAG: hypothetical protein CO189_03345 [candidate division Zixibacteria bacterium CG_4_9_14_3_um_filter_46_8]